MARRDAVLARLDMLPPSADRQRQRLELVTRAFLDSPHFAAAIDLGWSEDELFGSASDALEFRLPEQGLVTGLALSSLSGPKLEAIEAARAVVRCASGSRLTAQRRPPGGSPGRPWFEQPAFTDRGSAADAA
ncbi:MAG: hypothetical protein K2Z80_12325 [Xanthobacteraceae bacterium]|nr:hypothetical protein [Xanthobacteraceae bacterium]